MDPRRVLGVPPAPPRRALFRAAWLVGLLALVALLLVPAATLAAPSSHNTIGLSHAQVAPSVDPSANPTPTPIDSSAPTPTPADSTAPTPTPSGSTAGSTPTPVGTLRVCKVIEDGSGNVVSGAAAWAAAPHGEFMIGDLNPSYSAWAPAVAGTFGTVVFNTGNTPNTNLPGLGDGLNAQCMTIPALPLLVHYYYSMETITSDPNSAWQVVGYNDTFTDAISGISTFKPYNGCLFVSPNDTSCSRDLNADGDIFLGNNGVNDRTLVVLNQFRTPTPTPTPTPSNPATCQQSGQPCNTPTPTPVVTPTPTPPASPTPTPVVTPTPSGSVLPTTGTPRPSGSVLTATGSPRPTLPVTSSGDNPNGTGGSALPLFMLLIGAAILGLFLGSPLPRKVRR